MPGIAHSLVDLRLLVAALVVRHDGRIRGLVLLQRLAHTGHIPVAENTECARNQALAELLAANRIHGVLLGQELDHGLRHGHPTGRHLFLLRYFHGDTV